MRNDTTKNVPYKYRENVEYNHLSYFVLFDSKSKNKMKRFSV